MTSPNPTRRALAGAGAALTAAAFAVGLTAAPVQAQESLDVQAWAEPEESPDFYVGWTEETESQQARLMVETRGANGGELLENVHIELGLSDQIQGITFATDDPACIADGATLDCNFVDQYVDSDFDIYFDVLVGPGVTANEQADWLVTVEPGGYAPTEILGTWTFLATDDAEWDYTVNASDFEDVAPGATVTPEIAFANTGASTYRGVIFSFWNDDPHLSVASQYSNCGIFREEEVMCAFPDLTPAPGEVYELAADTPITVTLGANVPGPMTFRQGFHVSPLDVWGQYYLDEVEFFDAEQELVFELTDRTEIEKSAQTTIVSAANPFDMTVAAQRIDGEAGKDTTVPVVVENLGPADALARAHPGSGDGRFNIAIQLPTGVEATGFNEYGYIELDGTFCNSVEMNEWMGNIDPAVFGLERIDVMCDGPDSLLVDAEYAFDLPVTVTDAKPATDGLVSVMESADTWDFTDFEEYWGLTEADYPTIDGDLENNVAALSLNAAVPGGGNGSEQLPTTGVSLTVVGATAAAALAAGVVVFVLLRRRKAAASW
ncbi:LPXTG cell wall anchor domain-containing protein [Glycomyces sp. YM15]|uniref:LPXTG cell wall anchor domain-containing protein n=1 Tax=Glycomyces sp. YM15 TaxID=2800446 RepID=UPI0019642B7D|nr:LPXTG cell wall anchor domain-containing protein [Glycomyces sp. YM15]